MEEKNRYASLKQMDVSYGTYRDAATKQADPQKITYQVELGDTLKALASGYGVESASIVTTSKMDDSVLTNHTVLQINGKDAANMNTYLDYSSKEGYIQIPELSSSYLDLTSTMQEAAATIPASNLYLSASDMEKYLPESGQIDKVITTYSDIILKNLNKVERSKETLTSGDVSQDCTKLSVTCDGKDVTKIAKEILEQLQKDEVVKAYIEKIDPNVYSSFQTQVADALAALDEEEADDSKLEMAVYVDEDAQIVGRILTLTSGDESFEIKSLQPHKDSKSGYDLSVSADNVQYFTLTGMMEEKNDKLSGDFSVSLDESLNPGDGSVLSMTDIVKISIRDLDQKAMKKDGSLKGSIELSSEQIPAVAGYTLRIDMDNTTDQLNNKVEIMAGSDVFVTIQIASEKAEDPGVTRPEEGAVVYDMSDEIELATYTSELDLLTFLSDLKTNCGVDFTTLLGDAFMAGLPMQ
ncbi:MAG: hypothetical protein K2J67_03180 [Lachnospiraceae bacterium]|nr:hypothetical protein [Lachnospiraceae bacterium]